LQGSTALGVVLDGLPDGVISLIEGIDVGLKRIRGLLRLGRGGAGLLQL
jgi:hypothetical protein